MRENADQNNSEYGHFSRSVMIILGKSLGNFIWTNKLVI